MFSRVITRATLTGRLREPLIGLPQTRLEVDGRRVPEQRLRPADGGAGPPDVSGAWFRVDHVERAATQMGDGVDKVQEHHGAPAAYVEHRVLNRRAEREQIALDDVVDVREVPGLAAVTVDCDDASFQGRLDEARNDGGILRVGVLPGAEDVEVAQA